MFLSKTSISRYGDPEEITKLTAFLVSPAAWWLTGSALRMGGGEATSI
jgi:3-oxoacyl-[acyl-carrier protein] reductase